MFKNNYEDMTTCLLMKSCRIHNAISFVQKSPETPPPLLPHGSNYFYKDPQNLDYPQFVKKKNAENARNTRIYEY